MTQFLDEGKQRIANLCGLKYTNSDLMQLQACLALDDGVFDILFGCDEALLAGWTLGVRGAVGSTYNIASAVFHRVIRAFDAGNIESARLEQAKATKMIRTMYAFDFLPAAKCVMAMLGVDCGPVRSPLRNLTRQQIEALYEQLTELDVFDGLLSLPETVSVARS